MAKVSVMIPAREKDLGGFHVRRLLPYKTHSMVGPFIFFDHMGPASFGPGQGIDVRPHPHINLATVTYLFKGKIRHRDSLGSDQLIEPGAINLMTAGHGIVHSERTPQELRVAGSEIDGIQSWVALPDDYEEVEPSFTHYAADVLPQFKIDDVTLRLLLGEAYGYNSPVKVYSDLFYLDVKMPAGSKLKFPISGRESAAYIVSGETIINGESVGHCAMAVVAPCSEMNIFAVTETRLMLLGGAAIGKRYIYWNFVASTKEKIEQAKLDWGTHGPGDENSRFPKIIGDDQEFIPLPEDQEPKATVM